MHTRTRTQAALDEGDEKLAKQLQKVFGDRGVSSSILDLMSAAVDGNAPLVKSLVLELGSANMVDHHGQAALHAAALEGHANVIRALLPLGADVSLLDKTGVTAWSKRPSWRGRRWPPRAFLAASGRTRRRLAALRAREEERPLRSLTMTIQA